MRYLPVSVYTSGNTDCTNGGITSTHADKLVVPCPSGHISERDVVENDYVVLELNESSVSGYPPHFRELGQEQSVMFGGNFVFVYSNDSRFNKMYGHSPIKVHDRIV